MAITAMGPKMRPTPQYRRNRSISGGDGVSSTVLYTASVRCATSGQLYESFSWAWKAMGSVKRHSGMASLMARTCSSGVDSGGRGGAQQ